MQLSDDQIKDVTAKIKELADVRTQSMDDVDTVLRVCELARSLVLVGFLAACLGRKKKKS